MTREEKIKKLFEMNLEIFLLTNPRDEEINNLYRDMKKYLIKAREMFKKEDEENE